MFDDSAFASCNFVPWIGADYEAASLRGLRILVLGESHYRWGLDPIQERDATRLVMEDEITGAHAHSFHSRVAKTVLGADSCTSREDQRRFWSGVAFYNYVQEFVGDRPGDRPSPAAWSTAAIALPCVLEALRPDFILACGRALYEHLKSVPNLTADPLYGADSLTRSRTIATGPNAHAIVGLVHHPASRGFSPAAWHPRVLSYLDRACDLNAGRRIES